MCKSDVLRQKKTHELIFFYHLSMFECVFKYIFLTTVDIVTNKKILWKRNVVGVLQHYDINK